LVEVVVLVAEAEEGEDLGRDGVDLEGGGEECGGGVEGEDDVVVASDLQRLPLIPLPQRVPHHLLKTVRSILKPNVPL